MLRRPSPAKIEPAGPKPICTQPMQGGGEPNPKRPQLRPDMYTIMHRVCFIWSRHTSWSDAIVSPAAGHLELRVCDRPQAAVQRSRASADHPRMRRAAARAAAALLPAGGCCRGTSAGCVSRAAAATRRETSQISEHSGVKFTKQEGSAVGKWFAAISIAIGRLLWIRGTRAREGAEARRYSTFDDHGCTDTISPFSIPDSSPQHASHTVFLTFFGSVCSHSDTQREAE